MRLATFSQSGLCSMAVLRAALAKLVLTAWMLAASPQASAVFLNDWNPPESPPASTSSVEAYTSAYYGGFYPTPTWVRDGGHKLGWAPPEFRPLASRRTQTGEFWLSNLFGDGVDWPTPLDTDTPTLDTDPRSELGYDRAFYLEEISDPLDLVEMVPAATRIWGRERTGSRVVDPAEPDRALCWRPDMPGRIFYLDGENCPTTAEFDPRAYPIAEGYSECTLSPPGGISYSYYQNAPCVSLAESVYYVEGQYETALRISTLAEAARNLAITYESAHRLGDANAPQIGQRAAAILVGFAHAFPQWKRVLRFDRGATSEEGRFSEPGDTSSIHAYGGIWGDRMHNGLSVEPTQLAIAYDLLVDGGPEIWGFLDAHYGPDVRKAIEVDLFFGTIEEAFSYDLSPEFSAPQHALFNQAPYQARGLMLIGAAIGAPEVVRYGLWKMRLLIRKAFMHDRSWPESPAYFKQVVSNLENGLRAMAGWTEPLGFASRIHHLGVGESRVEDEIQRLRFRVESSHDVLDTLCRPGEPGDTAHRLIPTQDTADGVKCKTQPVNPGRPYTPIGFEPDSTGALVPVPMRPSLLQGRARGVLARGLADASGVRTGDDVRLDVGAGANWGHAHSDRLATLLWANGVPVSYEAGGKATGADLGPANTLHHNTVRLGKQKQDTKLPGERTSNHWEGQVLAWHPVPDEMQVIEVQDLFAYRGFDDDRSLDDTPIETNEYRRTLYLIPVDDPDRTGAKRNLVLDLFEVATASPVHQEFLVHGRPGRSQEIRVHRTDVTQHHDAPYFGGSEGAVFRQAGSRTFSPPLRVDFREAVPSDAPTDLALWILGPERGFELARGVSEVNDGASFLAIESPDATSSRFAVLWEAVPKDGSPLVSGAELLESPSSDATGVRITTRDRQTVEVYDNPSRGTLTWPGGVETRGRFVGVHRVAGASPEATRPVNRLWMYEASGYVELGDLSVRPDSRQPRAITETAPSSDPLWDFSALDARYESVARTNVDPQRMVQVRSTAAMPGASGVDCAKSYKHSRWIPLEALLAAMPDILQIAPVDDLGSGFLHDPSPASLTDTYNPFHTRNLCDVDDPDWPVVPVLQWPERAVLRQGNGGAWHLLKDKSNVPVQIDVLGARLPAVVPAPEPAGSLALGAGILCLYALAARSARRQRSPASRFNAGR